MRYAAALTESWFDEHPLTMLDCGGRRSDRRLCDTSSGSSAGAKKAHFLARTRKVGGSLKRLRPSHVRVCRSTRGLGCLCRCRRSGTTR